MDISKICERIKERRKELGMTQKELADAMHVSNQLISKWETGESVPSLEYLQQLSEALQTSVSALMGETAASAPAEPAPSEPKEKTPSKAKIFWKKHRKPLLISIICVAAALVILAIALLSVYVFVPSANKDSYVDNIDKGIDKYLEYGYFNIKCSTEVDGDEDQSPDFLQGYLDENGNAVYYNSVTGEIVKNQVITYEYGYDFRQKDYVQPKSIETVSDLLRELLKTWDDMDDDFDLDDITYIRKSGSGYYLEFSEESFFEDFKPSEKKNIKLIDKFKGRVEMDGEITKSIEASVKFRDTVSGEDYFIKSKIEFIQTKPIIKHKYYIETAQAERATKEEFIEKINAVSLKNALSAEFKEALEDGRLYYDNGYLYTHTYSSFIVFDQNTFAVKQQVNNLRIQNYASINNGAIWYVHLGYPDNQLCRYDLKTKETVDKLPVNDDFSYAGNKHYFCANRKSGSGDVKSFVYDMSSQKKIMESKTDEVKQVDDAGNIYCYNSNQDSLYIYGTDKKLQGREIVKKADDVVYTRDKTDSTLLYQYKSGELITEIRLASDDASFGDKYSWDTYTNEICYLDGEKITLPQYIALSKADNKDTEYRVKLLRVLDNWAFCYFSSYSSDDTYIGLFQLGEQSSLVAFTSELSGSLGVSRFGNRTFLTVYHGGLQDFLLIRS